MPYTRPIAISWILMMFFVAPALADEPFVLNVDVEVAEKVLEKEPAIIVLDVRTPKEYKAGHLADAKLVDFFADDFKQKLAALDKDTPYLVHCAVGGRSAKARDMMKQMGFTKIYHLEGGIKAWQKADKPVVSE